jgi:hypothetical protein
MANQIARQWVADPSADAPERVAQHLSAFWEHEMREDLVQAVEAGAVEVDAVVRAALERMHACV